MTRESHTIFADVGDHRSQRAFSFDDPRVSSISRDPPDTGAADSLVPLPRASQRRGGTSSLRSLHVGSPSGGPSSGPWNQPLKPSPLIIFPTSFRREKYAAIRRKDPGENHDFTASGYKDRLPLKQQR